MLVAKRLMRLTFAGVTVVAASMTLSAAAVADSGYVVRDLGTYGNYTCSPPFPPGCAVWDGAGVTAFNNVGQVAGWTLVGNGANSNDEFGFVATAGQPFVVMAFGTRVGPIGWEQFPRAMNDFGAAVGWTEVEFYAGGAPFLYSSGVLQNLGYLCSPGCGALRGSGRGGEATDVNEHGQVVGWAKADPPLCPTNPYDWSCYPDHAFLWEDGTMKDLGTLPDAADSRANGVTNAGVVVGESGGHGVIWAAGAIHDLGAGTKVAVTTADAVLVTSASGQFIWSGGMMAPLKLAGVDTVLDLNRWGQALALQGDSLVFYSAGTTRRIADLPSSSSRPLVDPVLTVNNLAQFAGAVEATNNRVNQRKNTNAALLTDTGTPTCTVVPPSSARTLAIEVQDTGSGLLDVAANAAHPKTNVTVEHFAPGSLQPVSVTVKGPPTHGVVVRVSDIAGNTTTCTS